MVTILSNPDDLLADLIPPAAFGAVAPPPPPRAPPVRAAPPRAAAPPAAEDPADDIYSRRVAQLEAAKHGSPGASPEAVKVAHAAQVQSDYADAKAQARAAATKGRSMVHDAGLAIDRVINPDRWGGGSDLSDLVTGGPKKTTAEKALALGAGGFGPLIGMATGGLAAAGNIWTNADRKRAGQAPVDTNAVYRAYRDVQDEDRRQLAGDYPGSTITGAIGGMKAAGGLASKGGELLAGLPGVEAATTAIKNWGPIAAAAKQAKGIKLAGQLALKPGFMDWLADTAQTGLSAIPGGALYSGLEGHTPAEHAGNALKGGLFAGATGTALGAALPLARFGVNAGKDIAAFVKSLAVKEPEEGLITPADMEAAKAKVAEMARQAGVQSSNIQAKAAPFTRPLAGQLLGVQGQNLTGSLARRQGDTGDKIRTLAFTRAQNRPDELKAATTKALGVDPDEARAMAHGIVTLGQDEVRPLYEAIGDNPFGVNSSELDRVLGTKIGKTILGQVHERAKLNSWSPEGLTWAEMEKPPPEGAAVGAHPNEAPPVGNRIIQPGEAPPDLGPAPEVRVPRAPASQPSQGMPLHVWLAHQGGVSGPDMGEAMARDIGRIGARSKQNAKLVEELAMRARDAGYWPHYGEIPTNSEFLDAVMNSQSKPHFPIHNPTQGAAAVKATERYQAAENAKSQNWAAEGRQAEAQVQSDEAFRAQQAKDAAATEEWRRAHSELTPEEHASMEPPGGAEPPAGYPGQAAPEYEPVPTTGLTPQSLVLLHQKSAPAYDEFGKLVPGEANEDRRDFHNALGRILLGHPETGEGALLPQYKAPLAAAQRYKATQGAYNGGKGLLLNGSDEDFAAYFDGLKDKGGALNPDKLRGAQLRAAQDVYELAYRGALRGGKFSPPGVEDKLGKLFTPEGARALVAKMGATAEQAAAEARMAPFSNSSSAAMLNAGAETDQSTQHVMDAVSATAKGGAMAGAAELAKKAWAYRLSQGTSVGYRNALGQLMRMEPKEFQAFLQEMESRPPPPRKPSVAKPVGSAVGATVGSITAPRF